MLALALIAALAVTSAEADCLSQYGPGCTSCATLTTGNRRLLHGGGRGAGPDRGHFGHNETGTPSLPADFLTCTACDTTGYVLKTETRGTYTFGHCGECCGLHWATLSGQAYNTAAGTAAAANPSQHWQDFWEAFKLHMFCLACGVGRVLE